MNVIENNQPRAFSVFRWESQLVIDQVSVQLLRAECERSQHMGWSVSMYSSLLHSLSIIQSGCFFLLLLWIWTTQRSIPPKLEHDSLLITTGVPPTSFFLSKSLLHFLACASTFSCCLRAYIEDHYCFYQPLIYPRVFWIRGCRVRRSPLSFSPGPLFISISIFLPSFPALRSILLIYPSSSSFFILFYYPYNQSIQFSNLSLDW